MFSIDTDPTKNLLTIEFSGHCDVPQARRHLENLKSAASQLQPGFRLLTDLSALDLMDNDCAPYLRQAMDICNAHGVSLVIRVIPDPHKDIGLNILSIFHYRRGVRIVTFQTMEEAQALLNNAIS
jgi:anti-anti-sigma regulatory factor